MVRSIFNSLVVILLAVYPVKATFTACTNYILTSPFYDNAQGGFSSQTSNGAFTYTANPSVSTFKQATISCSSIYMNNTSWTMQGDYSGCTSKDSFGLGFWVYFETTIGSNYIWLFTTVTFDSAAHGVVSTTDGVLTLKAEGLTDLTFNVKLNSWIFLVFHWTGTSGVEVYSSGYDPAIMTTTNANYKKPSDWGMYFGRRIKAKFYQYIGFSQVSSYDQQTIVTLNDGTDSYVATVSPTGVCTDTVMHPTQNCLSQTSNCTECDAGAFTCKTCELPYALPSRFCNIDHYCPSNCAACTSSTLCTQCMTNYFNYNNAGTTACISCDTSCSSCNPGPGCFKCASTVAQVGSTCRVDKIGYQISFSSPNIEIDFASPLASTLMISSLTATSNQGTPINTDNWTLNPCTAGLSTCKIVTDNLSESQLPVDIDFQFIIG